MNTGSESLLFVEQVEIATMSSHYKALLVVMVVTALAFWLARSTFVRFMSEEDFARRRNLWLGLTFLAFVLPNFWLYMAVAAVLIWRVAKQDANPVALYLFLLLAIPPYQQEVPAYGHLPLNHYRLLALVLILPTAVRLSRLGRNTFGEPARATWYLPDVLLVVYAFLPILVRLPYLSVTTSVRSALLVVLDLLLPYYVLSRSCQTKNEIVEAVAAFVLSGVVLAPLAMVETLRGWLMYSSLSGNWGIDDDVYSYLFRGDALRAQVTSGQSILLGNFFAVLLPLYLYLQPRLVGWRSWLGLAAILGGLVAAFSRGPWIGAIVATFTFFAAGPYATRRIFKLVGLLALVSAGVLASPWGARIIDNLPFVGTVDVGNIVYRQLLNDRSWAIIQLNPFFGSPNFVSYMQDLRTGEGIIDLLNVYLSIGMAYGLVTLAVFVSFMAVVTLKGLRVVRVNAAADLDASRLGAALFAALAGELLTIYTVSNYLSVPYIYTSLAALMVAYSNLPDVLGLESGALDGPSASHGDRTYSVRT